MEVVKKSLNFFAEIINNTSYLKIVSICTVVIIYFFSLPVRNSNFLCLLDNSRIQSITGEIKSNPVLTSSRKYYQCKFKPDKCFYKQNSLLFEYNSKGIITVLFPSEQIESHYPGKLFSITKNNFIVESGCFVNLEGSFISTEEKNANLFCVNSVKFLSWKNLFSKVRGLLRIQFKRLMFLWGEAGGLLLALLSGSKEYLQSALISAFTIAGLSHVLALSGMHVSIFSKTTEKMFCIFLGHNITKLLSLIIVVLFVFFAGLSPSLSRALISTIIIFVTLKLNIRINQFDILCLSFLVQIIIFPSDGNAISFILSYSALGGILILGSYFNRLLCPFIGTTLASNFSSSIGAIIATSPISLVVWGYVTPIGIISTLIISPLITIFLVLGLFCIILSIVIPVLSNPLGMIIQIVYYCIANIATFFSKCSPIFL